MIYLYGNGNAENHGCEALSRTLPEILGDNVEEFAVNALNSEVRAYGLKQKDLERNWEDFSYIEKVIYKIACKLKMHQIYNNIRYQDLIKAVQKNDICLSIGGDNYCYGDISWLQSLNTALSQKGKTVLMGSSIEPDLIQRKDVLKDLKKYSLIIARESITYKALCENGLNEKTVLYPDTAFVLKKEKCKLPHGFQEGNMVGINISPTIMEAGENQETVYSAYENLIRYILEETDMGVALIPHVVWKRSDDRIPLKKLYKRFEDTGKVVVVENQNCQRLKYIISKCKLFVAARTHASIAAYSTCIPTLVIGYSVKAKGIAKDIFGDWEHYVVPVQDISEKQDLKHAFIWLQTNETRIREHLQCFVPEYCDKVWQIKEKIFNLLVN